MNTTRNKSAFPLFEEGVRGSLCKGSLLLLLALFGTLSLHAQVVEVYKAGNILYSCNDADSIVFRALPDIRDAFSVSADKQVRFSKGNLQYTQSTQTWSFAEHQYDMLGTDNVADGTVSDDATYGYSKSGTSLADKIDLFGWSDTIGTVIDDGRTWYILTYDEWSYLLSKRANADQLKGVARINFNADGTQYANGLVLLPDSWTRPAGVTFKSGFASGFDVQAYADYQTFTLSDWQLLEATGAVFLPVSGSRDGSDVYFVMLGRGNYRSATPRGSDDAYYLYFSTREANAYGGNRNNGQAVRLVRDL